MFYLVVFSWVCFAFFFFFCFLNPLVGTVPSPPFVGRPLEAARFSARSKPVLHTINPKYIILPCLFVGFLKVLPAFYWTFLLFICLRPSLKFDFKTKPLQFLATQNISIHCEHHKKTCRVHTTDPQASAKKHFSGALVPQVHVASAMLPRSQTGWIFIHGAVSQKENPIGDHGFWSIFPFASHVSCGWLLGWLRASKASGKPAKNLCVDKKLRQHL